METFDGEERLRPGQIDCDEVLAAAEGCRRQVMLFAQKDRGMTNADFITRVAAYRNLSPRQRERVQVLLMKMPSLSCSVGTHRAAHFYPRAIAPEGAFNVAMVAKIVKGS